MRRVKCLNNGYVSLTINKVYDVIREIPSTYGDHTIVIINDSGGEVAYYYRPMVFEDVTMEYRNCVIDEILI